MTLEAGHSHEAVRWYLSARHGDMTARIAPGMRLGEDAAGELSFEPTRSALEFDLTDYGALVLRVLSPSHELELPNGPHMRRAARTAIVSPEMRAEVWFRNSVFTISTDFVALAPEADSLEIEVVRTSRIRPLLRRVKAALGPARALHHAKRANAVDPRISGEPHPSPVAPDRQLIPRSSSWSLVETPVAGDVGRASKAISRLRSAARIAAGVGLALVVVAGPALYLAFQDTQPAPANPAQTPVAEVHPTEEAPSRQTPTAPDPRLVEHSELLATVDELLESEELPESTIALALQSLKTLRVAYPEDAAVRDALEKLTERLAGDARRSYEQGNPFRAGRLIEQAASTGLAREVVSGTMAYLATADAAPRTKAQPAERAADGPVTEPPPPGITAAAGEDETVPVRTQIPEPAVASRSDAMDLDEPPPRGGPDEPETDIATSVNLDRQDLPEPLPDSAAEPAQGEPFPAIAEAPVPAPDEPPTAAERPIANDEPAPIEPVPGPDTANDPAVALVDPGTVLAQLEAKPIALFPELASLPEPVATPREADTPTTPAEATSQPVAAEEPGTDFRPLAELTVISQEPPRFPRRAPRGAEGSVELAITVSETGEVADLEIVGESASYFNRAAERAVRRWRFEPVLEDGVPIAVRTAAKITFRAN